MDNPEYACGGCGGELECGEVVLLFEVGTCREERGEVGLLLNSIGDYAFDPVFMDKACWDDAQGVIEDIVSDSLEGPIRLAQHEVCVTCEVCANMLQKGDPVIRKSRGQLRKSKKTGFTFQRESGFEYVCPQCVVCVQETSFPSWEELIDVWQGAAPLRADWRSE